MQHEAPRIERHRLSRFKRIARARVPGALDHRHVARIRMPMRRIHHVRRKLHRTTYMPGLLDPPATPPAAPHDCRDIPPLHLRGLIRTNAGSSCATPAAAPTQNTQNDDPGGNSENRAHASALPPVTRSRRRHTSLYRSARAHPPPPHVTLSHRIRKTYLFFVALPRRFNIADVRLLNDGSDDAH